MASGFSRTLAALAFVILASARLSAHDPGLSALTVHVGVDRIVAALSVDAADVKLVTTNPGDARRDMGAIAIEGIHASLDGEPLACTIDEVTIGADGSAHVTLSFMTRGTSGEEKLQLASDVPKRFPRGHRQLVTVSIDDRVVAQQLLDATSGPVSVKFDGSRESAWASAARFLGLGVRHILSGYDHLVFLAGLLLASRRVRELVGALTAFTAAHSVTLALAAIGLVHAPPAIVEPLIALSIAWVGLENLFAPQRGARWLVVFGFGLVHGFGFAEALRELGLGRTTLETSVALLSFNGGVEMGQLLVAALLSPFVWAMRQRPEWRARLVPACSIAIVVLGGYWLIERL